MSLAELVQKNRSYRRFDQSFAIEKETLYTLVDLARLTPSGRNAQPLKYILSTDPATNALIFQHLAWAAYLKEWDGPAEGERPAAYIIILGDNEILSQINCDHGIAAQTILLGAVELGLGGCILTSVQRPRLREALSIPERYEIMLVIALGKPAEQVAIEDLPPGGDYKYWRDAQGIHHVPKRSLTEVIAAEY